MGLTQDSSPPCLGDVAEDDVGHQEGGRDRQQCERLLETLWLRRKINITDES